MKGSPENFAYGAENGDDTPGDHHGSGPAIRRRGDRRAGNPAWHIHPEQGGPASEKKAGDPEAKE